MQIRRAIKTAAATHLVLLALALPSPASSLELTEDALVARALDVSSDLSDAQQRLRIADARAATSRSLLPRNPFVSLSFWSTTDERILRQSDGTSEEETRNPSYTFSLSQTLEIAGQRGKRMELAAHNREVAQANLGAARVSVETEARKAFYSALEAHARARLFFELLHWQREMAPAYDTSSQSVRNGQHIRIARAESAYAGARHSLFLQENRIREILRLPPDEPITLEGELPDRAQPLPSEDTMLAAARAQRAELAAHQAAAASDEAYLELTRRSAIPDVTLSASITKSDDDPGDDIQYGGSISMSLPVFRGAGPRIEEAVAEQIRSRTELDNVERFVERQVREARYACATAGADLARISREILPRARENADIQDSAFDRGEAGVWELVNAEIDLVNARLELLSAQRIYANAIVDLEDAIGIRLAQLADTPQTGSAE